MKSLIILSVFVFVLYSIGNSNLSVNSTDNLIDTDLTDVVDVQMSDINTENASIKRTFQIVCVGDVSMADVEDSISIIRRFLLTQGVDIKLVQGDNISLDESFLINSTDGSSSEILDDQMFLSSYSNNNGVIFLTDKRMYDTKVRDYVRGYSTGFDMIVRTNNGFFKETFVHELGHLLGLSHCDDLTCVMSVNNDEYDSGNFCGKCKNHFRK
jgi:hypothetical protein